MSPYQAQRYAGSWRVVDAQGQPVSEHGAGSQGAANAKAAATHLNKQPVATLQPNEVRAWRKAHSLTQAQLAKLLGVQWLAVQRWETGARGVPPFLHLALKQLERELVKTASPG